MYTVTLKHGMFEKQFMIKDCMIALDFAEKAKEYGLPYTDSTGERYELEVSITIEKCAGSGNSEVAHIKNQENDSTD